MVSSSDILKASILIVDDQEANVSLLERSRSPFSSALSLVSRIRLKNSTVSSSVSSRPSIGSGGHRSRLGVRRLCGRDRSSSDTRLASFGLRDRALPAHIHRATSTSEYTGWFFHLALWQVSLVGTAMLFRAARHTGPAWNGRVLFGSMLAGCGLFNFLEGIIDHQILGIHHVLPGHPHQLWFDMLFLANGVLFFMIGARLIRPPRGATD